jgi:hypothetical protein
MAPILAAELWRNYIYAVLSFLFENIKREIKLQGKAFQENAKRSGACCKMEEHLPAWHIQRGYFSL